MTDFDPTQRASEPSGGSSAIDSTSPPSDNKLTRKEVT